MLKSLKVAVTGGLSSGKSTICRFFKELGAYVVSADEIVHKLLSPDTNLGQQVIQLLGAEVVVDQRIDRKSIANKVFNNPRLLRQLENLLHPAVGAELKKQYQQQNEKQLRSLFVAEIPLLFEAHMESWFDVTIAVLSDEKSAKTRFAAHTGNTEQEYYVRMSQQLSPADKAAKANFVLTNESDLESLKKQVTNIYQTLTKS